LSRTSPSSSSSLRVHAMLPRSQVNGPGVRTVIWLQGCKRRCPGCFNPRARPLKGGFTMTPQQLLRQVESYRTDGVTISGGEPLLQMTPLLEFLNLIRSTSTLTVILYTGYTLEEIQALPLGMQLLSTVDILIDGAYDRSQPASDGIRGSLNQRIHFLSDRYSESDLIRAERKEIMILPDGTIIKTGVWTTNPPCSSAP